MQNPMTPDDESLDWLHEFDVVQCVLGSGPTRSQYLAVSDAGRRVLGTADVIAFARGSFDEGCIEGKLHEARKAGGFFTSYVRSDTFEEAAAHVARHLNP
jgi:hypothetical protein